MKTAFKTSPYKVLNSGLETGSFTPFLFPYLSISILLSSASLTFLHYKIIMHCYVIFSYFDCFPSPWETTLNNSAQLKNSWQNKENLVRFLYTEVNPIFLAKASILTGGLHSHHVRKISELTFLWCHHFTTIYLNTTMISLWTSTSSSLKLN